MIARELAGKLAEEAKSYAVISVTGPRQSGKTTMVKDLFRDYVYTNLEEPDTRKYALTDARKFLKQAKHMIVDEIQYAPDLLSYIQAFTDEDKDLRYVITGSQNLLISEKISQSMAGRVFVASLFPLSISELEQAGLAEAEPAMQLHKGFYPKVYLEGIKSDSWYSNYIQTYLERDVRNMKSVEDLTTFQKFMGLLAGRTGQILNLTSLASDVGATVPTIKAWLSILEASYIVKLLPSYHTNWNKRMIKAPKVYFLDTGLVCSLLGIHSGTELDRHSLIGSIFETYVFAEYVKKKANFNLGANMYYWKDKTGREVDILLEEGAVTEAVEVKYGETVNQDFFTNLDIYKALSKTPVKTSVVYGGRGKQARGDHMLVGWREL